MVEWLDQIWQAIQPYVAGFVATGGLGAILVAVAKASITKFANKVDVEKIAKETTEKAVEKIKEVSFKQNIQPLVESELQKVNEKTNEYVDLQMKMMKEEYKRIIAILEKFYAYFDDSFVAKEKKDELKQEIENAKAIDNEINTVVESTVEVKEEKPKKTPKKETKTQEDVLF